MIGIIVHSHTGHTLTVARRLAEALSADGHEVALKPLETVGPANPSAETVALKNPPSIDRYDVLILASPVNGGRMSGAMRSYLDQISSLEGKQVAILLTHFLPYAWGAKQTIEQMTEICESKGATVIGTADVRWSSPRRGRQIARAVETLSDLFQRVVR